MANLKKVDASFWPVEEVDLAEDMRHFEKMSDGEHHFIDTNVREQKEKDHLLNAIDTVPCVQRKAEWRLNFFDRGRAPS